MEAEAEAEVEAEAEAEAEAEVEVCFMRLGSFISESVQDLVEARMSIEELNAKIQRLETETSEKDMLLQTSSSQLAANGQSAGATAQVSYSPVSLRLPC